MNARQFHPLIEWERFAFGFAALLLLASVAYTAAALVRGLSDLGSLLIGFAPLYALSIIVTSIALVLRRKRLDSLRDREALVSRLLEQR